MMLEGRVSSADLNATIVPAPIGIGNAFVIVVGALLLTYLFLDTSFHVVLRKDSFFYTLKGMEIVNGNYDLYRSHAVGWPAFSHK